MSNPQSPGFTKREQLALVAFAVLLLAAFFTPQQVIIDWEWALLLFVVVPLGFYIATDPERRAK